MKRILLFVTSIPLLAGAIGFALPAEQAGLVSEVIMAPPSTVWDRMERQTRAAGTLVEAAPPDRLTREADGLREMIDLRPSGPATLVTIRGEVRIDNPYSRLAAFLFFPVEVRLRQDLHALQNGPS